MNKYQCQVCGAVSYSAASQENLKDDSCLECDGRVEMVDGDKMNADEIVKKIRSANICDIAIARMEAADLIESMQAQLAKPQRLNDEPPAYKFYYCESEDSYLLGRRVDNFYYAHWHEGLGFVWDMSRYLPWGEHVVSPATAWKEHAYPSEPKEIAPGEWFSGFIAQRLAASQRRERAAVEDLIFACGKQPSVNDDCSICDICAHKKEDSSCPKQCFMNSLGGSNRWQWRGPQAEEGAEK